MDKDIKKYLGIVVLLVILSAVFFLIISQKEEILKPIGGEKDEHGCLGPAGYSWNDEEDSCVRVWLLDKRIYLYEEKSKCLVEEYECDEEYVRFDNDLGCGCEPWDLRQK